MLFLLFSKKCYLAGMNITDPFNQKTGRANETWLSIYNKETVSQRRNSGLFIVEFE